MLARRPFVRPLDAYGRGDANFVRRPDGGLDAGHLAKFRLPSVCGGQKLRTERGAGAELRRDARFIDLERCHAVRCEKSDALHALQRGEKRGQEMGVFDDIGGRLAARCLARMRPVSTGRTGASSAESVSSMRKTGCAFSASAGHTPMASSMAFTAEVSATVRPSDAAPALSSARGSTMAML